MKIITISLFLILSIQFVGCASEGRTGVKSWTLRRDGHLRAAQYNEDHSLDQYFDKLKEVEGSDYALVVTPEGEKLISAKMKELRERNLKLEEEISACNLGK